MYKMLTLALIIQNVFITKYFVLIFTTHGKKYCEACEVEYKVELSFKSQKNLRHVLSH
jgi:hypothetical protein